MAKQPSRRQTGPSGKCSWTTLAADPNSDRIGLSVLTENEDLWLAVWDGSAWNEVDKLSATIDTNRQYVSKHGDRV